MNDDNAATSRLGVLEETNDGWRLRYRRWLGKPPQTVWRAFTEPDLVARWFPTSIAGELVPGATLKFDFRDHEADPFDGTVLEVAEPHLLVIKWGPDVLRFELAEAAGGTELALTVLLGEHGRAARDGAGWHLCLDNLAKLWLDGAGSTATETFATIHPVYVERFGPEAATIGPPQPT